MTLNCAILYSLVIQTQLVVKFIMHVRLLFGHTLTKNIIFNYEMAVALEAQLTGPIPLWILQSCIREVRTPSSLNLIMGLLLFG